MKDMDEYWQRVTLRSQQAESLNDLVVRKKRVRIGRDGLGLRVVSGRLFYRQYNREGEQ